MFVSVIRNVRFAMTNAIRHISMVGNLQKDSKHGEPPEDENVPKESENVDDKDKEPLDNQVLVKIRSAPTKSSKKGKQHNESDIPIIGGNECVAEVLSIGKNESKVSAGQLVVAYTTKFGSWNTHAIFSEEQLMPVPAKIGLTNEAAVPVNSCAAYRMLKDFAPLGKGDWIIQNGANSAVGQAVHQLCKAWDLQSVGIIPKRGKIEPLKQLLRNLGATLVFTEEEIRETKLKKDEKPRLALNCIGGKSAVQLLRHLGEEGVMVTYNDQSSVPILANTSSLIFQGLSLRGFWMSRWTEENLYTMQRKQMFEELLALIQNGQLLPASQDIVHWG